MKQICAALAISVWPDLVEQWLGTIEIVTP